MESNKRLLLAGAIAAIVVLAVPALALASVWKDHGTKVASLVTLNMSGGELFEAPSGNGMSCEVQATMTTEGGSTGKITTFDIKKCPTGFGSFAKCELNTAEAKGLPWTVDVNTSDLTITDMRTKRTFKGTGCSAGELDKTISSVKVTLNTPTEISSMDYLGEITGYKTAGTLTIEGSNKGTYEIS